MALDFPASPTTGQTYTSGGQTWTYNGVGWASTYQASGFVRQAFTATAGQTVFTVVGGYTPTLIDVYQNGVKLINGTDVTVTSGTTITLATGAVVNDIIEVLGIAAVANTPFLPLAGGTMIGAITFAGAQTIAGTLLTNTSVAVGKLNATGTPSASNFLRGDGSWTAVATSNPTTLTYNSSSTWTKATDVPAGCTMAMIECWGGGGGGSRATALAYQCGGGGGAYDFVVVPISSLGATETVTVGAAGLGATTAASGGAGGNSSFGTWITATGGAGGSGSGGQAPFFMTSNGSGGGGTNIAGFYASMYTSDGATFYPNPQTFNGGGGNFGSATLSAQSSVYGGGGGGGYATTTAGTSRFGGNGGAGGATPTAGTQPGGGGGACSTVANTNGANGGAGRVKITMW